MLSWRGKVEQADNTVFQCGRNILKAKIIKKEEGNLADVLRQDNYKHIIPTAKSLEEAIKYIEKLYKSTEGTFTTYYFAS